MGQPPLVFVDAGDNEGRINDDFSIEYVGPEHVEPYVDETLDNATSSEQAFKDLLLDMIHDLDIREVRRNGDRVTHYQED